MTESIKQNLSTIDLLQSWFQEKCDGDWEHQGGILIETTDNPGWSITIHFDDLTDHGFDETISNKSYENSDEDFILFSFDETTQTLNIFCSVKHLEAALCIFLDYP